jgi:hypothetical protein
MPQARQLLLHCSPFGSCGNSCVAVQGCGSSSPLLSKTLSKHNLLNPWRQCALRGAAMKQEGEARRHPAPRSGLARQHAAETGLDRAHTAGLLAALTADAARPHEQQLFSSWHGLAALCLLRSQPLAGTLRAAALLFPPMANCAAGTARPGHARKVGAAARGDRLQQQCVQVAAMLRVPCTVRPGHA